MQTEPIVYSLFQKILQTKSVGPSLVENYETVTSLHDQMTSRHRWTWTLSDSIVEVDSYDCFHEGHGMWGFIVSQKPSNQQDDSAWYISLHGTIFGSAISYDSE